MKIYYEIATPYRIQYELNVRERKMHPIKVTYKPWDTTEQKNTTFCTWKMKQNMGMEKNKYKLNSDIRNVYMNGAFFTIFLMLLNKLYAVLLWTLMGAEKFIKFCGRESSPLGDFLVNFSNFLWFSLSL